MKKLLLSIAALTLAASAFAQAPAAPAAGATAPAATPAKHERMSFKKLDTNGDGQISRAEAAAAPKLAQNFDAIDTNKDGQLSKGELKAFRAAHKGERKAKAAPAVAPKS